MTLGQDEKYGIRETASPEDDASNAASAEQSLKELVRARQHAGHQNLTPAAGASADIQPSGSGGVSKASCNIRIYNKGSATVWINGTGNDGDGVKLTTDESLTLENHTSADGDKKVVTDSGAGSAADVNVEFDE